MCAIVNPNCICTITVQCNWKTKSYLNIVVFATKTLRQGNKFSDHPVNMGEIQRKNSKNPPN